MRLSAWEICLSRYDAFFLGMKIICCTSSDECYISARILTMHESIFFTNLFLNRIINVVISFCNYFNNCTIFFSVDFHFN